MLFRSSSMSSIASDMSIDTEPETIEEQLLAKTQELESLKAMVSPLMNLFRHHNQRGNRFEYGTDLDVIALKLLAEGESAECCHRVFEAFTDTFPCLVGENHSVPKSDYFVKLRSALPSLNRQQLSGFVENSSVLSFTVDSTPVMNSTDIFGTGLIDETGDYQALGLKESNGKKAEELCEDLQRAVAETGIGPEIKSKTVAVMSDQAPAQVKANRLWARQTSEEQGREIMVLPCLMHTTVLDS